VSERERERERERDCAYESVCAAANGRCTCVAISTHTHERVYLCFDIYLLCFDIPAVFRCIPVLRYTCYVSVYLCLGVSMFHSVHQFRYTGISTGYGFRSGNLVNTTISKVEGGRARCSVGWCVRVRSCPHASVGQPLCYMLYRHPSTFCLGNAPLPYYRTTSTFRLGNAPLPYYRTASTFCLYVQLASPPFLSVSGVSIMCLITVLCFFLQNHLYDLGLGELSDFGCYYNWGGVQVQ
jgi:hypothetical protein